MCFSVGGSFLQRGRISTEEAVLYEEGAFLKTRSILITVGLLLVETASSYIVKLLHSATVIKLLFRFSNLPPFSIFVSQHLLKRVIKNKSSSVINTLGNRGFLSRAARSIFDHRPTHPRPKTRAVKPLAPRVLGYTNVGRFAYTEVDSPTIS